MRSMLGHSHTLAKVDSKKPTSDSALRHNYKCQCETNTTQNQKCSYIDIRPRLPHFTVFVRQCVAILMASIQLFTQTNRKAGCSDDILLGSDGGGCRSESSPQLPLQQLALVPGAGQHGAVLSQATSQVGQRLSQSSHGDRLVHRVARRG